MIKLKKSQIVTIFSFLLFFSSYAQNYLQQIERLDIGLQDDDHNIYISSLSNGEFIFVGSPLSNDRAGQITIFQKINNSYVNEVIVEDQVNSYFGWALSSSEKGEVVVASAPYIYDNIKESAGYVKTFIKQNGKWKLSDQILFGTTKRENFGQSVKVSMDGKFLFVGSPAKSINSEEKKSGAVSIYIRENNFWKKTYELYASSCFGFGFNICTNYDGSIIAVSSKPREGVVELFHRKDDNSWEPIGDPIKSIDKQNRFGWSLSFNYLGNILGIGNPYDDNGTIEKAGSCSFYSINKSGWKKLDATLFGHENKNYLGGITFSNNSNLFAVSSWNNSKQGVKNSGNVALYYFENNKISKVSNSIYGLEEGNNLGKGVEFTGDDKKLIVGANRSFVNHNGIQQHKGYMKLYSISNYFSLIEKEVINKINIWQEKGEFEKSADYQNRVNENTRREMVEKFQKETINQLKKEYLESINFSQLEINEYDADNETFLLNSVELGEFIIPVEIKKAPVFKQHFRKSRFENADFALSNGKFVLTYLEIIDVHGFKHIYNNESLEEYSQSNISYNFSDIEIQDINEGYDINMITTKTKNISVGKSDVDTEIPELSKKSFNTYALVIGNEDYQSRQTSLTSEQNVDFALNDAIVFSQYCEKTLGIPQKQIKVLKNATYAEMQQGLSWLENLAKIENGNAKLIFYYSGHGLPDDITKEPYLIPTDVSGQNVKLALKLEDVYKKLSSYPSKQVLVFLDACFSGGARNESLLAMKGMKIKPQEESPLKNMVVFSSSSGEQTSAVNRGKQHGYFTYSLLKKLQESKGEVTLGALFDYISQSVAKETAIDGIIQTPQLKVGENIEDSWRNMKLSE